MAIPAMISVVPIARDAVIVSPSTTTSGQTG